MIINFIMSCSQSKRLFNKKKYFDNIKCQIFLFVNPNKLSDIKQIKVFIIKIKRLLRSNRIRIKTS